MKTHILILASIIFVILSAASAFGIANPAAVFCAEQGYDYETVSTEAGEAGICVIDGEEIDAWEYFRENKQPVEKNTEFQGLKEVSVSNKGFFKVESERAVSFDNLRGDALSEFDWREYNGEEWVTPIKSQGNCGSCWAFSTVGVVESRINIALNDSDYDIDLSEQDLVSCSGAGDCDGGQDGDAIAYMQSTGIVKESCFPYNASCSSGICNSCSQKCTDGELVKVLDYDLIGASASAIKQAINDYGPVTVYMAVYEDFSDDYISGVYQWEYGDYVGLHAISIVGYNNTGEYWICKNSWGSSWGENGYFRINYSENVLNFSSWNPSLVGEFFLDESYVVLSTDIDNDGIDDSADNCPEDANAGQADQDSDGIGDDCDLDVDGDGANNDEDNCPAVSNADQNDTDSDDIGDACDSDIDGDELNNTEDECPSEAGPLCNNGCPDNTPPSITISNAPEGDAYQNKNGDDLVNITVSDSCLDSVWWYNGTADIILESPYDINISEWPRDDYEIAIFANDSSENTGNTNYSFSINNPPVLENINDITANESDLIIVTANATDADGDNLTYTYPSPLNSSGKWQTTYQSSGTYPVNISASDGDLTDWQIVTVTVIEVEDADNDGLNNSNDTLIGDEDSINTTLDLGMTVNGSSNLSQIFDGTLPINITEDGDSLVEFDWNFTQDNLTMSDITIVTEGSEDYGYILVKGLDLTEQDSTKTVYMTDKNDDINTVCIADAELASITEISISCDEDSETLVTCDSTLQNGYNCTDVGGKYKIEGLTHSGIVEQCEDKDGDGYCADDDCDDENAAKHRNCNGGTGGGGGGGAATNTTSSQAKDNQLFALFRLGENAVRLNKTQIPIMVYEFTTNRDITNMNMITESLSAKPSYAKAPEGNVYKYLSISITGMSSADLEGNVNIKFKIEKSWFDDFAPESITLLRYVDGKWVELKTEMSKETDDYYYFNAESPGFSLFAITAEEKTEETTETEIAEETESKEFVKTTKSTGESVTITHPGENNTEQNLTTNVTILDDKEQKKASLTWIIIAVVVAGAAGAVLAKRMHRKPKKPKKQQNKKI